MIIPEKYSIYILYALAAILFFLLGIGLRRLISGKKNAADTPAQRTGTAVRADKPQKTAKSSGRREKKLTMTDVDAMNGHDFEYFCADLLRKNGFRKVSVTPASGDQGVDIIAVKGTAKYAVQCKRYASPLGNKPVQEVYTGRTFYGCRYGAVMTNSTFTPHAKDLAAHTGVLLWDRKVIGALMRGDRKSL